MGKYAVSAEVIKVDYNLEFADREPIEFHIRLDGETSRLIPNQTEPAEWTRLDRAPCPGCALPDDCQHCPVAVALQEVVEKCAGLTSHVPVTAHARIDERTTTMETTMQVALRSIVGLLMASSGCPSTAMLRPMARFHHPFASPQESLWRSVSNYLLAQYLRNKRGLSCDLNLEGLLSFYEKLHGVNIHVAHRLRSVADTEPNLNAIILLDIFAQEFPFAIQDNMSAFEPLYEPYLTPVDNTD